MRYSVICLIFTLVSSINLLFTSADLKNYLRVIHDSHSSKISRYLRNSPGLCGDCSSNLWMDDYFLVMEITVLAKFSDTRGNYGHLFYAILTAFVESTLICILLLLLCFLLLSQMFRDQFVVRGTWLAVGLALSILGNGVWRGMTRFTYTEVSLAI